MDETDLRSFVRRVRAVTDRAPPRSSDEVRSWVVEPMLDSLGWDTHPPECERDVDVGGTWIDYLLSVDGTPAAFAVAGDPSRPLEEAAIRTLRRTMGATGVERAIYTNGRSIALYAGPDGSDRLQCELTELPAHADAVSHFSAASARRRLERHSRDLAARRLAVRRSTLADAIAREVTEVAGPAYRRELETAAERFVDDLVRSLVDAPRADPIVDEGLSATEGRSDRPPADRSTPTAGEPIDETSARDEPETSRSNGSERPVETGSPDRERNGTEAEATVGSEEDDGGGDDGDENDGGEAGEYVVRFFNDRGSIGAIGHSRSADAMVAAAEFLFERGLSGIRVPWEAEEETVLNDEPMTADGSPMLAYRKLPNGYYLNTSGDVEARASRVERLASRAGFRAMLTGDWSSLE